MVEWLVGACVVEWLSGWVGGLERLSGLNGCCFQMRAGSHALCDRRHDAAIKPSQASFTLG